jgi:lipopolysaccharide export LptBFGC system permease protein LptF
MRVTKMESRMRILMPTIAAAALLAGCVTINIYFPAAAAERAADRIIEEIWQLREGGDAARTEQPAKPQ